MGAIRDEEKIHGIEESTERTSVAKPPTATITVAFGADEPDHYVLRIEDDGRGFEGVPNDAGADGLRNMCQRMKEIGGGCDIKGKPGSGTRVTLVLPWPAAR